MLIGCTYGRLLASASLLMRIDYSTFVAGSIGQQNDVMPIIEASIPRDAPLTLIERSGFSNAPVNLRDEELVALFGNMVRLYAKGNLNSFEDVARGSGLMETLYDVESVHRVDKPESFKAEELENTTEEGNKSSDTDRRDSVSLDINTLIVLETLHRGLTLYRWLSMRFSIAFPFYAEAARLKTRTERAIDYCLELIRANRQRRLAALGREPERKKNFHPKGFVRNQKSSRTYKNVFDRIPGSEQAQHAQ